MSLAGLSARLTRFSRIAYDTRSRSTAITVRARTDPSLCGASASFIGPDCRASSLRTTGATATDKSLPPLPIFTF